jgi:hypothetical protein
MLPNFTAGGALDLFFPWYNRHLAEQVGGEVARECRDDLWRQGYPCTASMSIAAIRGYLRAQAGECVGSRVDEVLFRHRLNPSLGARVVASAISQFVGMAVHDILSEELPASKRSLAA